jgi:SAM-dependent methyltransferase
VGRNFTDLQDYYETEAILRNRRPLRGKRVELQDVYLKLLHTEERVSILDFGAGPGRDLRAFQAAGYRCVGIDLAHGNARLAAETGLTVVPGSITALPLRSSSFDAGWCMSTLMHLDEDALVEALAEIVRVLTPSSPFVAGVWGRETEATVVGTDLPGKRRPFHLRSFERNQRLLTEWTTLEGAERWNAASGDWDYHVFWLRAP